MTAPHPETPSPTSDPLDKPLIAARRPAAIRPGTRLGRIIARLHTARVEYRFWHGRENRQEVTGSGRLHVEMGADQLHCRVLGDLFKSSPVTFIFHQFWLTRRGMILAVFDLVENRPPQNRAPSETFLHFNRLPDPAALRTAVAFREKSLRAHPMKPA